MERNIQKILETPMSRSEFIKNSGIALMLFLGGGLILKSLHGLTGNKNVDSGRGYGRSSYGG